MLKEIRIYTSNFMQYEHFSRRYHRIAVEILSSAPSNQKPGMQIM